MYNVKVLAKKLLYVVTYYSTNFYKTKNFLLTNYGIKREHGVQTLLTKANGKNIKNEADVKDAGLPLINNGRNMNFNCKHVNVAYVIL